MSLWLSIVEQQRTLWPGFGSVRLWFVDSELLQSGFGLHLLFGSGEFSENCRRVSRLFPQISCPCVFRVSGPPTQKAPPKAYLQKLLAFQLHIFELKNVSRRCSGCTEEQGLMHGTVRGVLVFDSGGSSGQGGGGVLTTVVSKIITQKN